MVKFKMSDCAIMICVSDKNCMKQCKDSNFPCYDFQLEPKIALNSNPSIMEQIAYLKLYYFPKALEYGLQNMIILDLDVGFTSSPTYLFQEFINSNVNDILVQQDVTFVMDRSVERWKTWYMYPMPNIGLMAMKNTSKVLKMFDLAWEDYKKSNINIRKYPGKDQNKVVEAMKISANKYDLNWGYFPNEATMLLDKQYKFDDVRIELGM